MAFDLNLPLGLVLTFSVTFLVSDAAVQQCSYWCHIYTLFTAENMCCDQSHSSSSINGNVQLTREKQIPEVQHHGDLNAAVSEDSKVNQSPKIILFWTHFFGRWDYEFGLGHKPFLDNQCPVSNCLTTSDRSLEKEASAVVFHLRNVNKDTVFPSNRLPNQSYVFFLQENPFNQWNHLAQFNGVFNLTMTYRLDSDAPVPYGGFLNTPSQRLDHNLRIKLVKGKKKLIAWFVSNCGPTHSKREDYVKQLQRYIEVDVYGKCGPLRCPDKDVPLLTARMNEECYNMLERDYKFYISFENNLCKDYITEKSYNILGRYVVPIVYGGGNYSTSMPPQSVINIRDFKSPKHLADFLVSLDGDDERYMEYFNWKNELEAIGQFKARGRGFCKLCEILNDRKREAKVYGDIHSWWDKDGSCDFKTPRDLKNSYEP